MLWYVPLEHLEMRYTSHLDRDIENYLKTSSIQYTKIAPPFVNTKIDKGSFLDSAFTIRYKSAQMEMIANLYSNGIVKEGDQFFFSDIWFPGIESLAYMNYFHKINPALTGLLHAGSFTDTDFVRDMERWAKNFEDILFDIFDEIYVGSSFIKNDVLKKRLVDRTKIVVTGFPLDTLELDLYKIDPSEKENIVVFNGRNVDEKQPWLFDQMAEMYADAPIKFVNTQKEKLSKPDYYRLLSKAKVIVSYALQENFGFGVLEAVHLGCIPIVPNRLVYPEHFTEQYLYNTFGESVDKCIDAVTNYQDWEVPQLRDYTKCMSRWFV